MTWNTGATPPPRRRRRWPFVLAALVVVIATVAAVPPVTHWWKSEQERSARLAWQPPPQIFLTESMRVQPVPGWRVGVADLGVPASTLETPSRIATNEDPLLANPLVGNLGDNAYFLAHSPGTPGPQWWLTGINVLDGHRLFPAVPLSSGTRRPECFLNGPDTVFCLENEIDNVTAWVIDSHTGRITYTGTTDLRAYPAKLAVHQVGSYAVAATQDQGVYGIGAHAETTWFVPGDGSIDQRHMGNLDTPPPELVTQTTAGRGSDGKVVFALRDGTVITPDIPEGLQQQKTIVYQGGFAAEIADPHPGSRRHVQFFDETGKRVNRKSIDGDLHGGADLLVIRTLIDSWSIFGSADAKLESAVYSLTGDKLLTLPEERGATLIGTTLFTVFGDNTTGYHLQHYDLRTGVPGKTCTDDIRRGDHIGTDGKVLVSEYGFPITGIKTKAYDLATCDLLWQDVAPADAFRKTWRLNTTLVRLSDDATELVSLVAPES